MNAKTYCTKHPVISIYAKDFMLGLRIHGIESENDGVYIYVAEHTMFGEDEIKYHRYSLYVSSGNQPYFMFNGKRCYLKDCLDIIRED